MAHPLIEEAQRAIEELGFRVTRVAGAPSLPGEQLLVSIPDDAQGRERQVLYTLYEGLGEHLDGAHLLQCFTRMPSAVAPEHRDELGRLLAAVNPLLPLGAYSFLSDGMVFLRVMMILTEHADTWGKIAAESLFITLFALDEFGGAVEAVAEGRQTAREAAAFDPRIGRIE